MYVHEAAARALTDLGVTHIFGVLGDANLYMVDRFQRLCGGKYVAFAHEAGAVLAANGYARTSRTLGVATVTHGPALTNTLTALVESVKDRTPVLLLCGDTNQVDKENLQNIDQRELIQGTGAGFEQQRAAHTLTEDIVSAARRAVVERRPVVLNMPVDYQWVDIEFVGCVARFPQPQVVQPDPAQIEEACAAIASSYRPIVVAGAGVATTDARQAVVRLAERIGAPLSTTLRGKDMFRGHPDNLGIFGGLSTAVAQDAIIHSDLVVAVGAGLNRWTTHDGELLRRKRLVHIDIDPSQIGRQFQPSIGIISDGAAAASAITALLEEIDLAPKGFAASQRDSIRIFDERDFTDLSTDSTLDTRAALARIDDEFPADRTFVLDGGRQMIRAMTMIHVREPTAYVHTLNSGSIGLGMGNAIGAWFGDPSRPVLLIAGDGGFMLGGLTEFNTAVRYGVDIVVVIFNDGAYGAEHVQYRRKNMDPSLSTFDWPEFASVADALGGKGYTVRNLAELEVALAEIPGRTRPVLIDIKVDPDKVDMAGH